MGRPSSSGTGSVWSLHQLLHIQHFRTTTPSFRHLNNSVRYNALRWHTHCCCCKRVLLLAQHRARSRSNLNQHDHIRFSEAAHEHFDEATIPPTDPSHRDQLHTAMPDRRRCGSSSHDIVLSDRMRGRQWQRRWPGVDPSRHRNHCVSYMGSGSRPLGHCLFRPLWSAITRSPG